MLLSGCLLLSLSWSNLGAAIPINQWVDGDYLQRRYPEGLTSLVQAFNLAVGAKLNPSIQYQEALSAEILAGSPILYINAVDIKRWPTREQGRVIRDWVEHGGFLFIDAGLQASFLQETAQSHSYAAWEVAAPVAKFLRQTFERNPEIVGVDHPIFQAWYSGLPDAKELPDNVRTYVVNEKWPNGTYSLMGLRWGQEYRVVLTPIICMGWGRDFSGAWSNHISFRVREYDPMVEARLRTTVAKSRQYEVPLLNNEKEVVFCENGEMPSWVREPNGRIRLFKYYRTSANDDFAHVFYTRFGINLLYYAMTR